MHHQEAIRRGRSRPAPVGCRDTRLGGMSQEVGVNTASIDPTARVDCTASIAGNVRIGAYAVIGPQVSIGPGSVIGPHCVLEGPLEIGADNRLGAHVVLGTEPQDLGYRGEPTRLVIGNGNQFREFVTIHRASTKQDFETRIGDHNLLMAYCHVGHDCRLGNHNVIANGTMLGGHVEIGNHVTIGGLCAVHQFGRVGDHAMLGGGTMAPMDIPPFCMASGNHARLLGLNRRGLLRAGFSAEVLVALKRAYKLLFRSPLLRAAAIQHIRDEPALRCDAVDSLLAFLESSKRGVSR